MKKVEIKKLGVGSIFKCILYLMIVPIAIFVLVGIGMTIFGFVADTYEVVGLGLFMAIGYPIIFIILYGLMGMLAGAIYNGLAGKFGGLEMTVEESEND